MSVMEQIDLFGSSAAAPEPPAQLVPQGREDDELDEWLAAPARDLLFANLPDFKADGGPLWHRVVINVEGSGPGPECPDGCTLQHWLSMQKLLREAWRDVPRQDRPALLSMKLPPIDYDRRQRIYRLAERRRRTGMRALVLSMRGRDGVMPPNAIYIGRKSVRYGGIAGSKWANPFTIPKHGNRDQVIARYREWIVTQPALMADLHELRGKDLVCWCAPEACHGDVLLDLLAAGDLFSGAS